MPLSDNTSAAFQYALKVLELSKEKSCPLYRLSDAKSQTFFVQEFIPCLLGTVKWESNKEQKNKLSRLVIELGKKQTHCTSLFDEIPSCKDDIEFFYLYHAFIVLKRFEEEKQKDQNGRDKKRIKLLESLEAQFKNNELLPRIWQGFRNDRKYLMTNIEKSASRPDCYQELYNAICSYYSGKVYVKKPPVNSDKEKKVSYTYKTPEITYERKDKGEKVVINEERKSDRRTKIVPPPPNLPPSPEIEKRFKTYSWISLVVFIIFFVIPAIRGIGGLSGPSIGNYSNGKSHSSNYGNNVRNDSSSSTSGRETSSNNGNNARKSSSSSMSAGELLGSTISSKKSSVPSESNKTEVDPFSQPGTSSKIRITNIENELSPVNVDVSDYDNGIIQKFWMGSIDYDKWSSSYFHSSDNTGEIVDNGNLYFGLRKLQAFSPEIVFLSKRLRACANPETNLVSCHSLLKIDHSDDYQFIVSHYDIPAKWSCGAYALYIDGKELIFLKTDKKYAYNNFIYSSDKKLATKYITDNNRTYTAKAKLAEGYHDFLFVFSVYSKMPQASNSSIAIKGALSSNPRTLNVSNMYIPKSKIPQEMPSVETADITISELPPAFQDEIKKINSEITRINKSLSSERNKLSRAKTQMQKSKTPEKLASNVDSLQKTVDSLEASLNEQGKKLKLIYYQLNRD